jgi:membrane protein implicated in regulation of membrane protease activity
MTGGQIVALIIAILLLLPGGCFLLFGIGLSDQYADDREAAVELLLIAAAILSLAGLLFWFAFRRRRTSRDSSPDIPPS